MPQMKKLPTWKIILFVTFENPELRNWSKNWSNAEMSEEPVPHQAGCHIRDCMVVKYILVESWISVFLQTFRLLHEEGFFVGASTGLNVSAAVQVAKKLGPGHTIVTCLCDTGQRYYAKLFSREVLESKGKKITHLGCMLQVLCGVCCKHAANASFIILVVVI